MCGYKIQLELHQWPDGRFCDSTRRGICHDCLERCSASRTIYNETKDITGYFSEIQFHCPSVSFLVKKMMKF